MRLGLYIAVLLGCVFLVTPGMSQERDKVPLVGLLMVNAAPDDTVVEAVRRGLHNAGYVDGRNVRIEYRVAHGREDRLASLAQELVQLKVNVIIVGAEAPARAAKQATHTIPIVFALYDVDPVAAGLIQSFGHPGGNITGIYSQQSELVGKRLELLRELLPGLTRVAVLSDAFSRPQLDQTNTAARTLNIQLHLVQMQPPYDFGKAFKSMVKSGDQALLVLFSPVFNTQQKQITALATKNKLPTMFQHPDSVRVGALMAYGPSREEIFGRTAYYIDRILKGATPSDLPVEESFDFRLAINMRTAKFIGVVVPESLLSRADELIR